MIVSNKKSSFYLWFQGAKVVIISREISDFALSSLNISKEFFYVNQIGPIFPVILRNFLYFAPKDYKIEFMISKILLLKVFAVIPPFTKHSGG